MIATPDVYKSQNSDCYIVFGEAKVEDSSTQAAQMSAAQALAAGGAGGHDEHDGHDHSGHDHAHGHDDDDDDDDVPELEEAEDSTAPVDETGVDPKDIELVMAQVNCSRAKAVRVLKENGGDLITASACSSPHSTSKRHSDNHINFCRSHGRKRVEYLHILFACCNRSFVIIWWSLTD